jgi:hypothetical protein
MVPTKGYATHSAAEPLKPFSFERPHPLPNDVQMEIPFRGVCHSDLHIARNEWGGTTYPCVPGHEIVRWWGNDVQYAINEIFARHGAAREAKKKTIAQTGSFSALPDKPTCRSATDARNRGATSSRLVEFR